MSLLLSEKMSLYVALQDIMELPQNTQIINLLGENARMIAATLGKDMVKLKNSAGTMLQVAEQVEDIVNALKQKLVDIGEYAAEVNTYLNKPEGIPPNIINYWPYDTADHLNLIIEYAGLSDHNRLVARKKLIFRAIFEDIATTEIDPGKLHPPQMMANIQNLMNKLP